MQDAALNGLTSNAQSLADRLGTQTTEALIRSVSGMKQVAGDGLTAAQEGAGAAGEQIGQLGQGITGGIQSLATPRLTVRMAWRAGRFVGRIEGAIRLGAFGVRFWWNRRRNRSHEQTRPEWPRMLAQWGPTTVASVYLAAQVWNRLRRQPASA